MPIIERKTFLDTPWLRVVGKTMNAGAEPFYSLELADYVAIVAVDENGAITVVRQYRPAVEDFTWELPAGLRDAGESPDATARRELLEETGLTASSWQSLDGGTWPDTGRLANRMWCFRATGVRAAADWQPEDGVEVARWSPAQLAAAIADGSFRHALHLAALFLAGISYGKTR